MSLQTQHTMVLSQEFSDGSQEWHCPTCGRRFVMQWPPHYKRTILEEGDVEVVHTGGMGGVNMGGSDVQAGETLQPGETFSADDASLSSETISADDPSLEAFKAWVDQQNW